VSMTTPFVSGTKGVVFNLDTQYYIQYLDSVYDWEPPSTPDTVVVNL
jgi:hypothetical protein